MSGICFACGQPLRQNPVVGEVDGNPVHYHQSCAESIDEHLTAAVSDGHQRLWDGNFCTRSMLDIEEEQPC